MPKSQPVRSIFATELARFVRVFPQLRDIKLVIITKECVSPGHCAKRDLAYQQGNTIALHARVRTLPRENIIGLIRHELGHAADDRVFARGSEQRADDIAELVTGQQIRYDKDFVQTIGHGTYPRPKHLHR